MRSIESALREEVPVGVRGGRKTAGHRDAETREAEIISPIEAFLPPTSSTSLFFNFSNGMM